MPGKRGRPKSISPDRGDGYATREAWQRIALRYADTAEDGESLDLMEDLKSEPVITPILKMADGGIAGVIAALRASDDEDAQSFMEAYDAVSKSDRARVSLEAIALVAGIGSKRLLEVATSACLYCGESSTKILLATSKHKLLKRAIQIGMTPRGVQDRDKILTAAGVFVAPKGAQIAIQTNVNVDNEERAQLSAPKPIYLDAGERLRAIHEAVEQRRLPSPPTTPVEIGGTLDRMQAETAEILVEDS